MCNQVGLSSWPINSLKQRTDNMKWHRLLSTTKTSYCVHAIFIFEMCQPALGHGHPVYSKLSVCTRLQDCSFGRCSESVSGLVRSATPTERCLFRRGRSPESPPTLQTLESFCRLRETYSTRLERY